MEALAAQKEENKPVWAACELRKRGGDSFAMDLPAAALGKDAGEKPDPALTACPKAPPVCLLPPTA